MDIHKPKPWHGLREFLKEYAIIVVGVLTALGAEQGVEWLHWRHEVAETRATLAGEIGRNIERMSRRRELGPCIDRRLGDVHRYLMQRAAGDRAPPPAKVGVRRGLLRLNTNAWETAKAAQLMAHMPVAERDRYSRLYNEFDFFVSNHREEGEAMAVIRLAEDAPMLEAADWSQVRLAWNRTAVVTAQQDRNLGAIIADAQAIVGPKSSRDLHGPANATDPQEDVVAMNQELCRSWYPPMPVAGR